MTGEKAYADAGHRVKYVLVAAPVAVFACGATHACLPFVAKQSLVDCFFQMKLLITQNYVTSLPKGIELIDGMAKCYFGHNF